MGLLSGGGPTVGMLAVNPGVRDVPLKPCRSAADIRGCERDPARYRPPGSRGRPPSDRRRPQHRRRLRAALRRRRRPRRSRHGRQGHLRPARRGVRRHRARDASPAATPPGSRSPATSSSRSARRRCAPTAPCCRSTPTRRRTTCSPILQQLARSGYTIALDELRRAGTERRGADVAVLDRQGRRAAPSTPTSSPRVLAAPQHAGRAARRHRASRDHAALRALPRARLHLLPGRVLRPAARSSSTAASPPPASARCAASAS